MVLQIGEGRGSGKEGSGLVAVGVPVHRVMAATVDVVVWASGGHPLDDSVGCAVTDSGVVTDSDSVTVV